jgi:hypothetical protein
MGREGTGEQGTEVACSGLPLFQAWLPDSQPNPHWINTDVKDENKQTKLE